jgi:hypothetical protein
MKSSTEFLIFAEYLWYMNLNEELQRIKEIMQVDEMAYPVDFDFAVFKSITSFAGRIKYANQHLIGKIGAGSGRAVFRVDDEKVMKIALNQKGIAQNDAEGEGYKQEYDVLARVFDVDPEGTWIEMELAKKVTPTRFKQLTGVDVYELATWLGYITGKVQYKSWQTNPPDLGENEFAEDLRNFVGDYDYTVPGDFIKINSYGEVLRDGQPRIVVVDFGFDSNSERMYQATIEKARARRGMYW